MDRSLFPVLALMLVAGCASPTVEPSPEYVFDLPRGFPAPKVPADNPMSVGKIELGRYLFYDPRLSLNEDVSCGTCHHQERAFSDGRVASLGTTGPSFAFPS